MISMTGTSTIVRNEFFSNKNLKNIQIMIHRIYYKYLLVFVASIFSILVYCNFCYQFWTHMQVDEFVHLVEIENKYIKGLYGRQILVHKQFENSILKIENFAKKYNLKIIVNSSYRYPGQQISSVVAKSVSRSNHKIGFAIDFNIVYKNKKYISSDLSRDNFNNLPKNIIKFINEIRSDKIMRWGGDFNPEDTVHIDVPLNINNKTLWNTHYNNCSSEYLKSSPKWMFWK